jgi:hypothetical protein
VASTRLSSSISPVTASMRSSSPAPVPIKTED